MEWHAQQSSAERISHLPVCPLFSSEEKERVSGENLTRENKVRGELVSPDLREVWRAEGEIVKEGRVDARSLAWQGNLLRNVNVVLRERWGLEGTDN